ncbi:tRNA (N6-isopentenyl adenosine(37)-C2)-methylthiotransferase MiaB [Candidatus Endowatersipora endosymbiont of Watersipora subatra]|uniref:tRNA (N6-isopentenyl adenosine(37)-C2)-methylthiotransferase MiaB n=1 Tax=Candidatus Endowatersipora endosymbiont of Watersipora subatra TaxID=3077946 RepID=UPI00312CAD2B
MEKADNPSDLSKGVTKKFFIKTWGCQMNVYDSTRMHDVLESNGYMRTDQIEEADLVLLNTCHIREKAAEKVYSSLGRIRKLKRNRADSNRPLTIGVTGCVAQAEGKEIIRRESAVDLVVGPQNYHCLPDIVERSRKHGPQIDTEYSVEEKFERLPLLASHNQFKRRSITAFLTVQEGCDKFCTFCVVPYTRGPEFSRPRNQILEEASALVDVGVKEITLLGQNVNAWHGKDANGGEIGLGGLLNELAMIKGIRRLRYVTSHPLDMDKSLINAHRDLESLMPYLHLPIQSGSNRILKAMNRKHTVQDYLSIVDQLRIARPDLVLSSDFIVGFPGETDRDFQDTLEIVQQICYSQAFSFKYSRRPGTPGSDMENQVDEGVKSERLERLQSLLKKQQLSFNTDCIGKVIDILLEKSGRDANQLIGKSPWLQSVIVDSKIGSIGDLISVKVTGATLNSLHAELS